MVVSALQSGANPNEKVDGVPLLKTVIDSYINHSTSSIDLFSDEEDVVDLLLERARCFIYLAQNFSTRVKLVASCVYR